MATNNPSQSPLQTYSEQQLLVMILTELRMLVRLSASEFDSSDDLEALRTEIMADNDITTSDGG